MAFSNILSRMSREGKGVIQKPRPSLSPNTPAPQPTGTRLTVMNDTSKAELQAAKAKAQRTQAVAQQFQQNQAAQQFRETQAPITREEVLKNVDSVNAGYNPDLNTRVAAILNTLLGSGPRDTSQEEAMAERKLAAAEAAALGQAKARSGFGGFGLSGAATGQDADIRKKAAQAASDAILGIQSGARTEYFDNLIQTAQVGIAQAQNEIDKQAWAVALEKIKQQEAQANASAGAKSDDELRAIAAAWPGGVLGYTKKQDLESQGFKFSVENTDNGRMYVDQFGNEYEIPSTDAQSHPTDDEGLVHSAG